MDIDEARRFVKNRFSDEPREWWHEGNEETFQELLNILTPYMSPELAARTLATAFWTAADEYGD